MTKSSASIYVLFSPDPNNSPQIVKSLLMPEQGRSFSLPANKIITNIAKQLKLDIPPEPSITIEGLSIRLYYPKLDCKIFKKIRIDSPLNSINHDDLAIVSSRLWEQSLQSQDNVQLGTIRSPAIKCLQESEYIRTLVDSSPRPSNFVFSALILTSCIVGLAIFCLCQVRNKQNG